MELIGLRTAILKPNFDLFEGITSALTRNKQRLGEGDVLVVNSKIVAVSQERVVELAPMQPSKTKKSRFGIGTEDPRFIALVEQEADVVVPGPMLLTIKNGIFTPAAGIDRSNTPEGTAVLWPKDPWGVALKLRGLLQKKFAIKKLGVIITDSTCHPLRAGTSGVALSWAGFKGVEDVRGKKDIYKKPLTVTKKAVADNLACAAQVLMGEADEKIPLVIVRSAPIVFTNSKPKNDEGTLKPDACLFSSLYTNLT